MDKKSIFLVLIFGLFIFTLSMFSLKRPESTEQLVELDNVGDFQVVKSEEKKKDTVKDSEKRLKADAANSCGDKIPVMVPGFLSEVNDSSVVLNINQAGYNEKRTVLVTKDTKILEARVSNKGQTLSEREISFKDLKLNTDVVASVVEDDDEELVAKQIKYLIFEN